MVDMQSSTEPAMSKRPKPFYRSQTKCWYVELAGKQIRLSASREEAFIKYAELMSVTAPIDVQSCAEIHFRFLHWVEKNRSPRTLEWYQFYLAKSLPILSAIDIAELKPYHLTAILDSQTLSDGGTHNLARAVQQMVSWACKQGYIDRSPLARFEKPPQLPRDEYITPEMFAQIMGILRSPHAKRLLEFAWETGARPQELTRIEIRHMETGRLVLPPNEAKGKKSIRIIYLTDRASEIIDLAITGRKSGLIFTNSKLQPWTRSNLNCLFARIKKKVGVRFHAGAFRKGYITDALKNGVDAVTLSHLVGHSSTTMIAKVYAKLHHDPIHMAGAAARAKSGRKALPVEGHADRVSDPVTDTGEGGKELTDLVD
jgi:integrase